jgi:hypothetical protein
MDPSFHIQSMFSSRYLLYHHTPLQLYPACLIQPIDFDDVTDSFAVWPMSDMGVLESPKIPRFLSARLRVLNDSSIGLKSGL